MKTTLLVKAINIKVRRTIKKMVGKINIQKVDVHWLAKLAPLIKAE